MKKKPLSKCCHAPMKVVGSPDFGDGDPVGSRESRHPEPQEVVIPTPENFLGGVNCAPVDEPPEDWRIDFGNFALRWVKTRHSDWNTRDKEYIALEAYVYLLLESEKAKSKKEERERCIEILRKAIAEATDSKDLVGIACAVSILRNLNPPQQ